MALTIEDLFKQVDYVVQDNSIGQSLYPQNYEDDFPHHICMEFDDGAHFQAWDKNDLVEPMANGSVLIKGAAYRCYVTQQIKFPQTQD